MDEFIKEVQEAEDLQTVVARYCAEDFEHSGARPNALITGAAAALARGNGGEIISTEEAIRAHNQHHPHYIIPLNRVTRRIPSGLINTISQTMTANNWQFSQFMGNFGTYVILYSSIVGGGAVVAGLNALALLCAFLAGLVLTQGLERTSLTGVGGRVIARAITMPGTNNWTAPIEPDYPIPEEWERTVHNTAEDVQMSRYQFILSNFWRDPRHPDSKYYTTGLITNRENIHSRVETRESKTRDETGEGFSELVVPVKELYPEAPLRCQAKRADGTRCTNVIHKDYLEKGMPWMCFCGTHGKNPDKYFPSRADNWAVDNSGEPEEMAKSTLPPKDRVVEKDVSDENKLRF